MTAALHIVRGVALRGAQGGVQLLMDVADRDHIVIGDGDITGDLTSTVNGIVLGQGASDTLITGCRIRQFTGAAILMQKQPAGPARCVISGVTLKDSPSTPYVEGADYREGPSITGIRSDAAAYVTAAAQVQLNYGAEFYQVIGGTPIQDLVPRNLGGE